MDTNNMIELIIALISLASLEIILGIDNVVMLAVVTSKLPKELQSKMRKIGLGLALIQRIILLMCISWVVRLKEPIIFVLNHGFSGRDLILLSGGHFLIAKATYEIHGTIEGGEGHEAKPLARNVSIPLMLLQITIMDAVFSLDSVITAVGMVDDIGVMIAAVVLAMIVMIVFANPISDFIIKHPTVKMLALSFLLLIGMVLVADGSGQPISKGYIYFAMAFAMAMEVLNFRLREKQKKRGKSH